MAKKDKYVYPSKLKQKYGFTPSLIKKYLGAPDAYGTVGGHRVPLHLKTKVEVITATDAFKADRERVRAEKRKKRELTPKSYLLQFDIWSEIEKARELDRRFVIHCGPTNSGKTYNAISELKKADEGIYLGPLRLLALEVFDKLNNDGKPCSLLTGEEFIDVPYAGVTASTIEMCDHLKRYDVAVIDEAQLITSSDRGGHWLNAILKVNAHTVHICTAPEALDIIKELLERFDARYETVFYERLTPLVFGGEFPLNEYSSARPGDAFIVFSRKAVLGVASELERNGIKASVIYGALPPPSRREEVRKLVSGETNVVVATDAIGMGVSLPIKRVIFCQTEKFDGTVYRMLKPSEIKQIAGRAGRFGIYDTGEVVTMQNADYIKAAVEEPTENVSGIVIPFPKEAADAPFELQTMFSAWQKLPSDKEFIRENMSDALTLYRVLKRTLGEAIFKYPQTEILRYITCPIELNSQELVQYWLRLTVAILLKRPVLPKPKILTDTLTECETSYKALDIQQQMLRRIGISEDTRQTKAMIESKIKLLLDSDKADMQQKCKYCGKTLSPISRFDVCDRCYVWFRRGH